MIGSGIMQRTMVIGLIMGCLLVSSSVMADFDDEFSNTDNWNDGGTDVEASASDGIMTVEAGSGGGFMLYTEKYSDFTYTVIQNCTTSGNNGVGLVFCFNQITNNYYTLMIYPGQQYVLRRSYDGTQEVIAAGYFSYIDRSGSNRLRVVKNGAEIAIYCNEYFVDAVTDQTLSEGWPGLILGGNEVVEYDRAICQTEINDNREYPTSFEDNFEDSDLYGWRAFSGSDDVTSGSGTMTIPASGGDTRTIYTDGDFSEGGVRAVINRTGGSDSSFYGITLMNTDVEFTSEGSITQSYSAYRFVISKSGNYAIYEMNTGGNFSYSSLITTVNEDGPDTLEITSDYNFMLNGQVLDKEIEVDNSAGFSAAGIYAESDVELEVSEFKAGDSSTPVDYYAEDREDKVRRKSVQTKNYEIGGTGIIYDIQGRRVTEFRNGYKEKLNDIQAGSYIIIGKDGIRKSVIRRVITGE